MDNKIKTKYVHIDSIRPLISPAILLEEIPSKPEIAAKLRSDREQIANILHGRDTRLLVVVGPCSIHDPAAALEYAQRLSKLAREHRECLHIVMRAYFEKPRTTVGWKGLINDPNLDGSFAINQGLRIARKLLRDIVDLGLAVGCEFLDPISPQYISDLVAWGAIGARTTESQVHRELASGLSMPIGFKNGTDGNVKVAIDGVLSARHPHNFLGVTEQGLAAVISTRGNQDCHIILRGGDGKPNYDEKSVLLAVDGLTRAGLPGRVMIDVSHGNSSKDYRRQPEVVYDIATQIKTGSGRILGLMIESFLIEGRQDLKDGKELVFGQSVTDACIDWDTTRALIEMLADASVKRSQLLAG